MEARKWALSVLFGVAVTGGLIWFGNTLDQKATAHYTASTAK